jgi:hypothetical protein
LKNKKEEKEKQEGKKPTIIWLSNRQLGEYSLQETRIKEQRQQEKSEQARREKEKLDEYIQT